MQDHEGCQIGERYGRRIGQNVYVKQKNAHRHKGGVRFDIHYGIPQIEVKAKKKTMSIITNPIITNIFTTVFMDLDLMPNLAYMKNSAEYMGEANDTIT